MGKYRSWMNLPGHRHGEVRVLDDDDPVVIRRVRSGSLERLDDPEDIIVDQTVAAEALPPASAGAPVEPEPEPVVVDDDPAPVDVEPEPEPEPARVKPRPRKRTAAKPDSQVEVEGRDDHTPSDPELAAEG